MPLVNITNFPVRCSPWKSNYLSIVNVPISRHLGYKREGIINSSFDYWWNISSIDFLVSTLKNDSHFYQSPEISQRWFWHTDKKGMVLRERKNRGSPSSLGQLKKIQYLKNSLVIDELQLHELEIKGPVHKISKTLPWIWTSQTSSDIYHVYLVL